MKELLQNDFFLEDTGLKVEVANTSTDGDEKEGFIQLRLRVVDPKKRKDKHKENEAIQFDFDTSSDVPENVAQEMVGLHSLAMKHLSRNMRFPTMWYVRPAKAQTSLRIRAV